MTLVLFGPRKNLHFPDFLNINTEISQIAGVWGTMPCHPLWWDVFGQQTHVEYALLIQFITQHGLSHLFIYTKWTED